MRTEWEVFKSDIHNSTDQFIIEKYNEINRYNDGVSEFVNNMAKIIHTNKDFVINCIFDEYDERKKRLDFTLLIFCNWVKNLIK